MLLRDDAPSTRHVCVALRAPEAPPRAGRLPVHLAFVIDRSGSMNGNKIAHARRAVQQGIRSLRESDRFAVVAYDEHIELPVPSTSAKAEARDAAVATVERISARGHTDLHGGWERGCQQVAEHLTKDAVGRCLLLTDGLANAGVTDFVEIVRQCAGWRDRHVVTSTFGVGADFDEEVLRRMSDAGGGNFQFIESAVQIADFVASEVGEALATTVREAVLVVDAGPGAVVESLNDFPCRQEGALWRVAIGSLQSGQPLEPVLRVSFPEGETGESRDVTVRALDQDRALGDASATLRFTWASQEKCDAAARDRAVDRLVAVLDAARAERDALERNRKGDYDGARHVIEACLARIREYAREDNELLALIADLREKAVRYSRAMDSLSSKSFHSLSSSTLRGRILRMPPRAPKVVPRSVVPSEWEAQGAVADVLSKIAGAHPDLLKPRDIRSLAEKLAHLDERGCLLDLGQDSEGAVEPLLHAPGLCAQCRSVFEFEGLGPDGLARIVEALRLLGAPSGVFH